MPGIISMIFLFFARIIDNILSTAKTILIQRNKGILAGITVVVSNFLYFSIMKKVVFAESSLAMTVVAVASGIGCSLAVLLSNHFSKERTMINVIMSDNKLAMQRFRDFLAEKHITNVATDSYTRDWEQKTITITAYAGTREENRQIDRYISESPLKFKRVVYKM